MQGVRALKAFIKTQNGLEWPGLDQLGSISEVVLQNQAYSKARVGEPDVVHSCTVLVTAWLKLCLVERLKDVFGHMITSARIL